MEALWKKSCWLLLSLHKNNFLAAIHTLRSAGFIRLFHQRHSLFVLFRQFIPFYSCPVLEVFTPAKIHIWLLFFHRYGVLFFIRNQATQAVDWFKIALRWIFKIQILWFYLNFLSDLIQENLKKIHGTLRSMSGVELGIWRRFCEAASSCLSSIRPITGSNYPWKPFA